MPDCKIPKYFHINQYYLGIHLISYFPGERMNDLMAVRGGGAVLLGASNTNFCISVAKYRNISILANASPAQALFPLPKGLRCGGRKTFPSESINLEGLNTNGLVHKFGSL